MRQGDVVQDTDHWRGVGQQVWNDGRRWMEEDKRTFWQWGRDGISGDSAGGVMVTCERIDRRDE